jgi:hypothetical protein
MTSSARPWIALCAVGALAWGCSGLRQDSISPSEAKLAAISAKSDEGPKPEHPGEWAQYFASFRQTPPGVAAVELNRRAIQEIKEVQASLLGAPQPRVWIENWGPGNFGGRLRGILVKPDDSTTLLVGSVAGGIFKSTDSGATWNVIDDFLPTLAVGSMLVDPDNDNRVFVGTGEGFFNVDSAQGLGIFISSDFGDTFTTLAGTDNSNFFFVNRIARIPGTTKLLAATRTGIWGTDDFTAVSPVWTERSGIVPDVRGFVDLQFDTTTSTPNGRLYAYNFGGTEAVRRVFRSTNDGASFTQLGAGEGIPTTDIRRMEIAVGTDGVVYLCVGNAADQTRGLWRSPAGGSAFVKTTSTTAFVERQGWYDLPCAAKPGDSNTVFMGAVDMYKTTNAGTTITKKTFWNPNTTQFPEQFIHADHHVIAFDPADAATMYMGSDGGIFKSVDSGETWSDLNGNLPVTQYYGIAAHPDGEHVIGGTQDNGSHLYFGDKALWLQWFGGDGGYSAWDQQDTRFIYGSTPQGGLFGSGDGGSTAAGITGFSTAGAPFIEPFTIDPNNGNRFIIGTNQVFFSGNIRNLGSATFSADSGAFAGGGAVTALTISPHSSSVAYAGTSAGRLFRTSTLGTPSTWTQLQDAAWGTSDVTWITVDPHDATGNTLYVTLADYGPDRVWKSVNGGTSWAAIDTGLPDIPQFSVVVDPVDPDRLWLGSELGLFTTDGNSTDSHSWTHLDYGVAFTRAIQLVWAGDDVLWIGTHGRSIYRLHRSPVSVAVGDVDDSAGGCEADGFLDLAENAVLPLTLTNETPFTLTNLLVTATPVGANLAVTSAPQAIASLAPGASDTVNHNIRLVLGAGCRTNVKLKITVAHDDGTGSSIVDVFTAADPVAGSLTEDAEDADTAFTTAAGVASGVWSRVSTQAHAGTSSWFASDIGGFCDKSLVTPAVDLGAGSTTLSFWLFYNTEGDASQRWDGVVLEVNVDGTDDWIDIGNLSSVAYDGALFSNNTAPARNAWSGNQQTWRNAVVNLGSTYNGQRIRVRWRMVCDESTGAAGFWIDDVSLSNVVTWPGCDALGCSALFSDGFNTGNSTAWSSCSPTCP